MEKRKVANIAEVLSVIDTILKTGDFDAGTYEALQTKYPLVDSVDFRRILGMSETISAWNWPKIETIKAVRTTLSDRIRRLDVEIKI